MSSAPIRILYVCTGNICRSPFAEAAALKYAERSGLPVQARSASTLGLDGRDPDPKMARVARELGISLSGTSTPLSAELIEWAEVISVMELRHAESVRSVATAAGLPDPAVTLLGPYAGSQEISDPHGSWTHRPYRRARDLLQQAVVAQLEQIASDRGL